MTGWKQGDLHSPDIVFLAEWQDNFLAFSRQPRSHQARGPFRDDNLTMRCNVIDVCVRNESELLGFPRVEPEILLRQKNAALVSNIDHTGILACRSVCSTAGTALTGETPAFRS